MMNCIKSVRLTLTSQEPGAIICTEVALSPGECQFRTYDSPRLMRCQRQTHRFNAIHHLRREPPPHAGRPRVAGPRTHPALRTFRTVPPRQSWQHCPCNISAAAEPYAPLVLPPAQPPFGEGANLLPRLPPPQRRTHSRAQPQSSAAVPTVAPVLRDTPQQHQEPSLSSPPHSSL